MAKVELTGIVETGNGAPCTFGRGLPGHRVEVIGKRIFSCQSLAEVVQVVFPNPTVVHPVAEGFIADELRDFDRFVHRCKLQR